MKKRPLPVDVRRSKTSLLKLTKLQTEGTATKLSETKITAQEVRIGYNNTANTEGSKDGQT